MESRNEYLYGQGTSTELINIPRNLYIDFAEARNKLVKSKKSLLIPKFVGVYQTKSATAKRCDLEETVFFAVNELFKNSLEIKMAIETAKAMGKNATTLQPSMIGVLYNPQQETRESVKYLFDDQLQRIAINPINEAPKFSDKDTSLKELILGNVKEIVSNEESYDEQVKLIKMNLKLMEEDRRQYGLTLEEWAFLNNSSILWGNDANIRNQRKLISEIRKSSKKIKEE